MGSYADAGELALATGLLDDMASAGVRPNRVVYVVEMLRLLQVTLAERPLALDQRDVEIVTGRGNHSTHLRQPVFRNLVLVLLQQMGIPVAFVEGNDGCLLVRSRQFADVL